MNMWQIVSGGHKNLHGRVKGLMILKLQEKRACSGSHPSSLAPAPSPNGPATSPSSEDLHAKHSLPPSLLPSLSLLVSGLLLFSLFECRKALFCPCLLTHCIFLVLSLFISSVLYHLNPPVDPLTAAHFSTPTLQ